MHSFQLQGKTGEQPGSRAASLIKAKRLYDSLSIFYFLLLTAFKVSMTGMIGKLDLLNSMPKPYSTLSVVKLIVGYVIQADNIFYSVHILYVIEKVQADRESQKNLPSRQCKSWIWPRRLPIGKGRSSGNRLWTQAHLDSLKGKTRGRGGLERRNRNQRKSQCLKRTTFFLCSNKLKNVGQSDSFTASMLPGYY